MLFYILWLRMENLLIYKFHTVWLSSSAFLYKQITRTWCTTYIGDSITEYRCRNRILYMRMRGKTVQRNLWKPWPSHPQITNNKTIPVADDGAEPCLLVLLSLCSEASESYKPTMPSCAAAKNVSKNPQKQKVYVKWYPQSCLFFFKWKWQALLLNPSFFKPLSLGRNKGNHMKPIFKLLLAYLGVPS